MLKRKSNLSQAQLVEAIKNDDRLVLKQLYQENFPKVKAHILSNSGSAAEAADLYQDAFILVYEKIKMGQFDPQNESAIQGFLFTIAKRRWIDIIRKKKRTHLDPVLVENLKDDQQIDEYTEPDQKLSIFKASFDILGESCKDLLSKFYFGKLNMKELAGALNITEASARNKKYRCMENLKAIVSSKNKAL